MILLQRLEKASATSSGPSSPLRSSINSQHEAPPAISSSCAQLHSPLPIFHRNQHHMHHIMHHLPPRATHRPPTKRPPRAIQVEALHKRQTAAQAPTNLHNLPRRRPHHQRHPRLALHILPFSRVRQRPALVLRRPVVPRRVQPGLRAAENGVRA